MNYEVGNSDYEWIREIVSLLVEEERLCEAIIEKSKI